MASKNGIVGEFDFPQVEMPHTQIDDSAMQELRKAARFSKTAEWKALKKHFEDRVDFYQRYLPDGRNIISVSHDEAANGWVAANAIIGELKGVIEVYENAAEMIKNAPTQ